MQKEEELQDEVKEIKRINDDLTSKKENLKCE
jgi:hypothetical protein